MKRINLSQDLAVNNGPILRRSLSERLHIDVPLLSGLILLLGYGLFILYSADNQSFALLVRQMIWVGGALVAMVLLAQIPPRKYYQWSVYLYGLGIVLLIAVLIIGHIGKGAQRWLNLGLLSFQPSEIMKFALPMTLAWVLNRRSVPPGFISICICLLLTGFPVLLVAKQPDLGTALIIACTGLCVLFLSGLRWGYILTMLLAIGLCVPAAWHFLHDYQRDRVLTFLNPERDPMGTGYHIIQSKIAIGSGGLLGKGYLHGTQSHLQFLPEHSTDFIFAVTGEELGLIGCLILVVLYLYVISRCLWISHLAQDTFGRLVAGSLTLTFFLSFFINMGMVTGILPVVGLPLPLISYGGTAMVTILAGFGIIMSIHTHRNLVGR